MRLRSRRCRAIRLAMQRSQRVRKRTMRWRSKRSTTWRRLLLHPMEARCPRPQPHGPRCGLPPRRCLGLRRAHLRCTA
eukprot:6996571-Alexandrium_andersonii.AAC.1